MKKIKISISINNPCSGVYYYSIFIPGLTTWNESYQPYKTYKGAERAAMMLCRRLNADCVVQK